MKNVLIINAAQRFGHSGGEFNATVERETLAFFAKFPEFEVRQTTIANGYDVEIEVQKFVWADLIIYHTPIWWFQLPNGFKKYLDEVLTAGHNEGIYHSDGRSSANPAINYGTGGLLHGRSYMVTTSWNAPETAFTLEGEFFGQTSVDDGPLFGFHKMNAFTGLTALPGFHFHDIEKNANVPRDMERYAKHLASVVTHGTQRTVRESHAV